ncbi:MAG: MBL fold metallo-hydrolase [Deltaproteobacteria bacterium]|nr:MBL fold metallo-hydrolase [Deltaproteobacteria bacterium]
MIRRVSGPYNLNTYFLVCKQTKESVIIDPGGSAKTLTTFIKEQKITPIKILNTHGHADQFFSTEEFKKTFSVPSCLHTEDDRFFKDPAVQEKTRNAVGLPPPYPADIELADKDVIEFGETNLAVIHTPGHTPGSVCFLCEDHLYTGDAIFVGEAGRTDLPGGNLDQLIDSIKTRILPLDKKTIIHPGHHHGEEFESTIQREMKENIYITDFILDD